MRSSHRPWEGGLEWVWSRWCLRLQSEPELWQQHIPTTVSQDFMRVFREGHYSLTIYSINMQPVLNWLSGGKGKRNQSQLYWETMIFQPWCQTHHYLVLTKAMTKPSGWNRSLEVEPQTRSLLSSWRALQRSLPQRDRHPVAPSRFLVLEPIASKMQAT